MPVVTVGSLPVPEVPDRPKGNGREFTPGRVRKPPDYPGRIGKATGLGQGRGPRAARPRGGQVTTHTGAPAPGLAPDDAGPVWHTLSADGVLRAEKVDEQSGLSSAEAASRAERFGPNKFDAGKVGAPVARVPPPVHRPDADRPAGGRRGEPAAEGVGDRHRPDRADAVQRGSRPAAGGEGRRGRRRPAEDDDHQGQGHARTASCRRSPPNSSSPATSSRSRRETSCLPTGGCCARRRWRSPSPR